MYKDNLQILNHGLKNLTILSKSLSLKIDCQNTELESGKVNAGDNQRSYGGRCFIV